MFNRTISKILKSAVFIVTVIIVLYFCVHSNSLRTSWVRAPIVVREAVDVFQPRDPRFFSQTAATSSIVDGDLQVSETPSNLYKISSTTRSGAAGADHAPSTTTGTTTHAQILNTGDRWQCSPRGYYSNVSVLGKRLEKCTPGSLTPKFAPEDIYITIKTTQKNHNARLLPILLTWLQTVQPDQVHIVTDNLAKDEELYKVSREIGIHVSQANCKVQGHVREALCCKSGAQYAEYFSTVANRSPQKPYRWFCHFDDDIYVNIPMLVAALQELELSTESNRTTGDDFYFGRWPVEAIRNPKLKNGYPITSKKLQRLGIIKQRIVVKWGTGAAYCFSLSLIQKLESQLKRHSYQDYCSKLGINDDLVAAVLAAVEGATLHNDIRIKTQYDLLRDIPPSELQSLITISYSVDNTVSIPGARFSVEEDPSRFLSYHCLLYPSISWCR